MMKFYTLYHYQIYTYLYMDIICNQSFSLLEIYYRYGYKLRDEKSEKDIGRRLRDLYFSYQEKNNHCSNVQGLGNMLNEESF